MLDCPANAQVVIYSQSKESLNRHTENGMVVMITEPRPINAATERTGEIILKASADKLLEHLVCDDANSIVDPTYIQDFLLTYRVFIDTPTKISNKLMIWFSASPNGGSQLVAAAAVSADHLKKKVYRIVLEWITNHFNDFENNRELYDFAEKFQETLSKEKMLEQFRVLTIAISTKSKPRTVTLARSKRDELLSFSIQGGWDKGYGIYVSRVDKDTKAYELGIRKGDQITEVNGQSFQHITYLNALDTLKSYTHLSITLKYNPIGFNEMLLHPEKSPYRNKKNIINNTNQNRAYLIEYLQRQQDQFQQSLTNLCGANNGDSLSMNGADSLSQSGGSTLNSSTTSHQKQKSIGSVLPPLPPGAGASQLYASNNQLVPPHNSSAFILSQSAASSMSSLSSQANYSSTATTPRGGKSNGKDVAGSNSSIASHFQKPTQRFRKAFEKFNRNLKPYSKDLASITAVDSSAPSLKSITRSPSPSLSNFTSIYNNGGVNNSTSSTNLAAVQQQQQQQPQGALYRNTSTGNLSGNETTNAINEANSAAAAAAAAVMSASLASISLEDQQQFVGEHVLKIYKNDQNFKYLVVHKETSTKEVVMLALNEFNIMDEVGSR